MTQIKKGQYQDCPACGSDKIDKSIESFAGVCTTCGFVVSEEIQQQPPDWEITDGSFERTVDRGWMSKCSVRNATEQRLAEAFKILEEFANQLNLSEEVRVDTVDIYCDAFRETITDGRKTTCVVAACLNLSSRRKGIPIPMGRLVEFPEVHERKFHRSHLALCENLEIEAQLPEPQEYISFLQSELCLTDSEKQEAERLASVVHGKQGLVGKDPAGVAAGGVYLSQQECTQADVAEVVGLSTETVRQRIRQLKDITGYD